MAKRERTKRAILEEPSAILPDYLGKYIDDKVKFTELVKQYPIYDNDGKPLENEKGIKNAIEIINRMGVTLVSEDYPDGVPQEKLYDVVSANLKDFKSKNKS